MSDELRDTFFLECEDLLEVLESGLLDLSNGDGDDETVNAVFRAAHSIKGGAGAFGLEALVRFAHKFETALDEVREKRLEPTGDVLKVFLRSSDILSDLVRAMRDETAVDDDAIAECSEELQKLIGDVEEEEASFEAQSLDFSLDLDDLDEGGAGDAAPLAGLDLDDDAAAAIGDDGETTYEIVFQPHHALYQRGNETTLILRALGALGDLETVCDLSGLPDLDNLGPDDATL
ncbi:MAG: Hpt domain-containing protein, partial [Pseudomonadota bacterium]